MDQNQKLLMSALVTEEAGKIKTAWSLAKVTRRNSIKKLAAQTGVSIDLIDSFIEIKVGSDGIKVGNVELKVGNVELTVGFKWVTLS